MLTSNSTPVFRRRVRGLLSPNAASRTPVIVMRDMSMASCDAMLARNERWATASKADAVMPSSTCEKRTTCGVPAGLGVGATVDVFVGVTVGDFIGEFVGAMVGALVGRMVGAGVGACVGACVA